MNKSLAVLSIAIASIFLILSFVIINQRNGYIIDRFEGDFVVLEREDRTTVNILRNQLPESAKEGDVITSEWQIDKTSTARIKKNIMNLFPD